MAYRTYTTEALVCGNRPHNTSDKSYLLFTRDAGMVYATARSVREERSKQRFALQDFSFVRVSLVRGKAGWRIGSVENERNVFTTATSRDTRAAVRRVVMLIRQFVHGEEPHPALYDDVRVALLALENVPRSAAVVDPFTLRLLHKLGYIAETEALRPVLTAHDWSTRTDPLPQTAQKAVENALSVSHL